MKSIDVLARKLSLFVLIFLSVMSFSCMAIAANITLYEGNGCTKDVVCIFDSTENVDDNFTKNPECDDNKVSALLLSEGVEAETRIRMYDDPKGSSQEAWANIYVFDLLDQEICIPSFDPEKPYNERYEEPVELRLYKNTNLDGKISHFTIIPSNR